MFGLSIAVGICLLSLGGYVSVELEKAGEVTEQYCCARGDASARGMGTFVPTLYNHLGEQELRLLKFLGSSVPGLKL